MIDPDRKRLALEAADRYFANWENDLHFSRTVREAMQAQKRNPLFAIFYADGYLAGQQQAEVTIARLTEALAITRDALQFYEADVPDERDPWRYDFERQHWYWRGGHPADLADFALRKASLAERGEPPPFEDYVGQAKARALEAGR